MRKLVSIQQILDVQPIPDADAIEVVTINSWKVVSRKGEFKTGDLCVYFEIDSFLPIKPEFEFLRKSSYKKLADDSEGFRLRTVKLRKQLSQGLALPLNTFIKNAMILGGRKLEIIVKDIKRSRFTLTDNRLTVKVSDLSKMSTLNAIIYHLLLQEKTGISMRGDVTVDEPSVVILRSVSKEHEIIASITKVLDADISELLGVTKYDPPLPAELAGQAIGFFPSYIHKSDQERIQNLWNEYKEKYQDIEFEVTLKLDGASCTFYHNNGEVGVCSRNLNLQINPDSTQGRVEKQLDIYNKLIALGRNIAIQSEIAGEGVQGNPEKLRGQHLYIFDVYDIDTQRYLTPNERYAILRELDLRSSQIPVLGRTKVFTEFKDCEELLKHAEGKSINNDCREGLVFKSMGLVDGKVISFKAISNSYLLNERS